MMKVVVVEDEALVRRGIVLAVDWASVNCAVAGEAADGAEGLEVIRQVQPDLVVTDIKMPRMDGIEMLRRLREAGNEVRAIILTAYRDFSYAQSALKLGAVDYLLKPFQDGELEAAIQALQRREAPPALPAGSSKSVTAAIGYIAAHYNAPDLCVGSIARSLAVSEGHLSHLFKRETNYTVNSYITTYRIRAAMELLRDCRSKVYEVAEAVGYRDITYFSSTFKKVVGVTPSEYQRQCQ